MHFSSDLRHACAVRTFSDPKQAGLPCLRPNNTCSPVMHARTHACTALRHSAAVLLLLRQEIAYLHKRRSRRKSGSVTNCEACQVPSATSASMTCSVHNMTAANMPDASTCGGYAAGEARPSYRHGSAASVPCFLPLLLPAAAVVPEKCSQWDAPRWQAWHRRRWWLQHRAARARLLAAIGEAPAGRQDAGTGVQYRQYKVCSGALAPL